MVLISAKTVTWIYFDIRIAVWRGEKNDSTKEKCFGVDVMSWV